MASEDELDLFLQLGSESDSGSKEDDCGNLDQECTSEIDAKAKEKLQKPVVQEIRQERVDPELDIQDLTNTRAKYSEECGLLLTRKSGSKGLDIPKAGYLCQFSKLKIEKPILGSEAVKSRLSQLRWTPLATLGFSGIVKEAESRSNNWATIGALAEKSEIRNSAQVFQGKPFICWTLYDLGTAVARLFLFDSAFNKCWREPVGTAWLVINAKAVAKNGKQGSCAVPALSVSRCDQVLKIGKAGDFGVCQAIKREGTKCEKPLNKSAGRFCEYHVSHQFKKLQSPRGGLGQTAVRNRVATKLCMEQQSKVTNSLSRASKQQRANVPAGARITHVEDWQAKACVNKRQKIGSLYVNVIKEQDKQVDDLRNKKVLRTKNVPIEMDDLNEAQLKGREAARQLILQRGIKFQAPNPNHPESSTLFPKVQNKPAKHFSPIDQLNARRPGYENVSRKMNSVAQSDSKHNQSLSTFSKAFASIAAQGETKEFARLIKAFEEEQYEDVCNYLDSLNEKEKLLIKMEQISELKKKGYYCRTCRESFLFKPRTCVDREHCIDSQMVAIRWFQCTTCKRVVSAFSKFPKRSCRNCSSDQLNGRETMMPADEFRSRVRDAYGKVEIETDMADRNL